MARSKSEPVPTIMAGLPRLPSDTVAPTIDDAPQVANDPTDDQTTLMSDSVAEPRSDAHAMPETAPPSLIDRLKAQADRERQERENEFAALVERLARDEGDENEVADMLQISGKSLADLEAAVDRQRKVNRLQSLIADLPDAVAAQREAQAAFTATKERHKKQSEEMAREFKAARGALNTAIRRRDISQTAEADLWRMSHEFPSPPPQWADPYRPDPATAAQLKVEERVNEEIRQRIKAKTGQEPMTGPYSAGGTTPANGFRVLAST